MNAGDWCALYVGMIYLTLGITAAAGGVPRDRFEWFVLAGVCLLWPIGLPWILTCVLFPRK
jgi:hypothetical protein